MWNVLVVYVQQFNDERFLQAWLNVFAVQFSNCAHGENDQNRPHGDAPMMFTITWPSHAQETTSISPTRLPNPLAPGPSTPQPQVSIRGCCASAFAQHFMQKFSSVLTFHPRKSPHWVTLKIYTKRPQSLSTVA